MKLACYFSCQGAKTDPVCRRLASIMQEFGAKSVLAFAGKIGILTMGHFAYKMIGKMATGSSLKTACLAAETYAYQKVGACHDIDTWLIVGDTAIKIETAHLAVQEKVSVF